VTAFFYALDSVLSRVVLHVFSLVWLVILPEMNPAIAMGWFIGNKDFRDGDLAHIWVNFVFLVFMCMSLTKLIDCGAQLTKEMIAQWKRYSKS
jgi:hypothetical protein